MRLGLPPPCRQPQVTLIACPSVPTTMFIRSGRWPADNRLPAVYTRRGPGRAAGSIASIGRPIDPRLMPRGGASPVRRRVGTDADSVLADLRARRAGRIAPARGPFDSIRYCAARAARPRARSTRVRCAGLLGRVALADLFSCVCPGDTDGGNSEFGPPPGQHAESGSRGCESRVARCGGLHLQCAAGEASAAPPGGGVDLPGDGSGLAGVRSTTILPSMVRPTGTRRTADPLSIRGGCDRETVISSRFVRRRSARTDIAVVVNGETLSMTPPRASGAARPIAVSSARRHPPSSAAASNPAKRLSAARRPNAPSAEELRMERFSLASLVAQGISPVTAIPRDKAPLRPSAPIGSVGPSPATRSIRKGQTLGSEARKAPDPSSRSDPTLAWSSSAEARNTLLQQQEWSVLPGPASFPDFSASGCNRIRPSTVTRGECRE